MATVPPLATTGTDPDTATAVKSDVQKVEASILAAVAKLEADGKKHHAIQLVIGILVIIGLLAVISHAL